MNQEEIEALVEEVKQLKKSKSIFSSANIAKFIGVVVMVASSFSGSIFLTKDTASDAATAEVDNTIHDELRKLKKSFDSLAVSNEKKAIDASVVASIVASNKDDLTESEKAEYTVKAFSILDKAINNDSSWTYVQQPFILWLMDNKSTLEYLFRYNLLCPVQDLEDNNRLYFQYIDGLRDIFERPVNGGVLRGFYDGAGDKHHIQMISNIKDN